LARKVSVNSIARRYFRRARDTSRGDSSRLAFAPPEKLRCDE
jgi:hypothetical protein